MSAKTFFSVGTAAGALLLLTAGSGVHFFRYDAQGRLVAQCKSFPGDGEMTRYTYDAASNRSHYSNVKTDITLQPGNAIYSPNGKFQFIFQGDSNLVLYVNSGSGWTPLGWATNTVGSGATVAVFQNDGNLVLYNAQGTGIWSSNTYANSCATIAVANDGNVTITSIDGNVLWSTNTGGH